MENPDKSSVLSLLAHEKWYTEDSEDLKNKPGLVSRNGTYYARMRVPTLLVGLLQKHEVKISLRTKNLNEARAKLPAALVEIHKQFAAATKVADAVAAPAEDVRRGTWPWTISTRQKALQAKTPVISSTPRRYFWNTLGAFSRGIA